MNEFKAKWRSFDYSKWKEADSQFDHETWDRLCKEGMDKAHEAGENWPEVLVASRRKAVEVCGEPPFCPRAWYNAEGDILEVYLSEEESYSKWLNHQVSVKLAMKTDEVVGFQIWGVSRIERIEELVKLVKLVKLLTKGS
ncbi:MAG: hypothetical protein ACXAC5_02635 [Promethearchaeota archaeon]